MSNNNNNNNLKRKSSSSSTLNQNEVIDVQKLLNRFNSNGSESSEINLDSNLFKKTLNQLSGSTSGGNNSKKIKNEDDDNNDIENDNFSSNEKQLLFEKNLKSHFKSIRFITICGKKLEIGDMSLATATIIYNKFFYFCEFSQFDPFLIATSAIYLATKIEEEHLKLRDIINVCYRTLHPHKAPLELNDVYWKLRNSITQCELLLVRVLQFKFNFDHPHKYLLNYLESLRHWIPLDVRVRLPVPETCWQILRDILHSNILLKYRSQEIAISVIYLVFMCYGIKVPFNDIAQKSWWKALDEKITRTKIHTIIKDVISVYEMDESLNLDNINFI